ncbi:Uncharacterized protein dnm_066250 [Desulfonema magnum]|uniref:Uncharacterized protein n=1 Tax=Desulfonema magnum TaxID=45655 RepID=A0A975BT19_9BACT|nr:Uncharacterized protein dnm_066250 [Desulfonema magnum]
MLSGGYGYPGVFIILTPIMNCRGISDIISKPILYGFRFSTHQSKNGTSFAFCYFFQFAF